MLYYHNYFDCEGVMADSGNNHASTASNLYEAVLSLSAKMGSCKSTSYSTLTEIKHELKSINQNFKERLTQQERETFAILLATTPELVRNYVSFADVLFSGNIHIKSL